MSAVEWIRREATTSRQSHAPGTLRPGAVIHYYIPLSAEAKRRKATPGYTRAGFGLHPLGNFLSFGGSGGAMVWSWICQSFQKLRKQESGSPSSDDVNIDDKIDTIFNDWIRPMLSDIRQILDVTAAKSSPDNHGVNFAANALILNGVDFVSNFYEYPEERQIEKWECERSELLSKLNKLDSITRSEKKRLVRLVRQERGPRNDTDAAIKFMKDFLPAPYGGIADGLWSVYRHGHTHLFVPKAIIGAGEVIQFGVAWTYLDTPSRTGISVKHVEDFINAGWEFARRKSQHLALCSNVFILNPHFFYVDFVNAATQFEGRLRNPKEARLREAFSRGYDQWINEIQITGDYANQLVKKIRRVAIPMSGQVI